MRGYLLLTSVLIAGLLSGCSNSDLLSRLNPELKEVERKQQETQSKLDELGVAMLGQTVPEIGFMTAQEFIPNESDEREDWVQLSLDQSYNLDQIVLVPAQVEWDAVDRTTYRFPIRFRVDVSDDPEFRSSTSIATFADQDFPDPDITPVVLPAHGIKAQFVRITVSRPTPFALAEVMVMKGNRNVAIGCHVGGSSSMYHTTRWGTANLVDGRTPLGPPIRRELFPYDGFFAGQSGGDSAVWMQLDLGKEMPIEEVRLHPVHGRMGADAPGYYFPLQFQIKLSNDPEFKSFVLGFETQKPLSNPGNNVVTIPLRGQRCRYARVQLSEAVPAGERRMALSEVEVYSDGENVARQATVTSTPDAGAYRKDWPKNILIDGNTSYGRILELPEWLKHWTQRKQSKIELAKMNARHVVLLASARQRLWWVLGGLGFLVIGGVTGFALNTRRVRLRELDQFRRRLTQDFHDDVGSNLAAIAVFSQHSAKQDGPNNREGWTEVNRIITETTTAMREMLWLAGTQTTMRINLMEHLELVARRMLPECEIEWQAVEPLLMKDQPDETRREVFLCFKEILANIVRHAFASRVKLSVKIVNGFLELEVRDNGRGFSSDSKAGGLGLQSLHERATRMRGTLKIESSLKNGTFVFLRVPVAGV